MLKLTVTALTTSYSIKLRCIEKGGPGHEKTDGKGAQFRKDLWDYLLSLRVKCVTFIEILDI